MEWNKSSHLPSDSYSSIDVVSPFSVLGMASVFCNSAGSVMLVVGAAFAVSYLLSLFPAVKEYMPSYLLQSTGLLAGLSEGADFLWAAAVTAMLIVSGCMISVTMFNKKNL